MTFPRVTVGGDAAGGWLVEIHDGETLKVYSPEAATADEAREKAMAEAGFAPTKTAQVDYTPVPPITTEPANDTNPPISPVA